MSFKAPFGVNNSHVQTIFSSCGPRRYWLHKRYQRFKQYESSQIVECADGVRLAGIYTQSPIKQAHDKMAILIHGWEGSADSSYMLSMAASLLGQGINVFRLNLRDHGNTHHLNYDLFNSTMIDEVVSAVAQIQQYYPHKHNYLIGFSLGGNFSLRVAALASPNKVNLDSVIAYCPVIHAKHSNHLLNTQYAFVYGRYFTKKWKQSLRAKLAHFPEYDYGDVLEQATTLDELNRIFIPQYTPYQQLDDYYDAYAISGDVLKHTICPCYLHFSKDDMIIPYQDVEQIADSPDLHITLTEQGGHCGFLENWQGESWQDRRALGLIKSNS